MMTGRVLRVWEYICVRMAVTGDTILSPLTMGIGGREGGREEQWVWEGGSDTERQNIFLFVDIISYISY